MQQVMASTRHCRLANAVAAIGAISSAVITASAGAPATAFAERFFSVLVVGWACVPYLATALLCYFIRQAKWTTVLSYGLLAYAIMDAYARVRGLYFPTGSTDSLVVLCLPVWPPAVVLVIGGASAAITSAVHRLSESRP
jgi:hypothetical protein